MLAVGAEKACHLPAVSPHAKFWNFRCKFLLSGALSAKKLTPAKVQNTTHCRLYYMHRLHPAWSNTRKMGHLGSRPWLWWDAEQRSQKTGRPGKNGIGGNAIWAMDSGGPSIRWGSRSPQEGALLRRMTMLEFSRMPLSTVPSGPQVRNSVHAVDQCSNCSRVSH